MDSTRFSPALLLAGAALMALASTGVPAAAAGQEAVRGRAPASGQAWLGIGYDVRWLQQGDRCEPRVVVESVVEGSPAQRAGLRPGDAILMVDEQPAPGSRLRALSARLSPGDSVRLRFERGGAVRLVTAVADRRPARPPAAAVTAPGSWLDRTSAPVVRIRGDTLEAWNIEPGRAWAGSRGGGYWFATADGRTEYRRLDRWSRDGLDRRVESLLVCADTLHWEEAPPAVARVNVQRIQERADSLRVVIARRAFEAAGDRERVVLRIAPTPPGAAPRLEELEATGPTVLFRRLEEHTAAGERSVAGAEVTPLEPELAEYFRGAREGLLVLRVARGSPADRAGLRPGDVITGAGTDGRRRSLESVEELRHALARPDQAPVELRLVRQGRARTVTLRHD